MRATLSGVRACVCDQIEHRVDRRMGAAAARIALDGDAGRDDVERRRPIAQHGVGVVIPGAVEHFEKALAVLQRILACGEAFAREQRRHRAVAGAMADMQRLGHGAEIGLEARRERGGDGERRRRLLGRKSHEMRGGGRSAEHAERRGRVPALVVVMEIDGARDARLGLEAGDISGDEVASGDGARIGEREQRRQHGR